MRLQSNEQQVQNHSTVVLNLRLSTEHQPYNLNLSILLIHICFALSKGLQINLLLDLQFYQCSHSIVWDQDLLSNDIYFICNVQDPNFWTYRPLSEQMVRAAADDVRFLLYIYYKMMEKLNQQSLWYLAVRGALYCRCFCINDNNFADWPPLPPIPGIESSLTTIPRLQNEMKYFAFI